VVQAVTWTAKPPRDPAAAAPPTEQRFAGAPLAKTPVAAAPSAETPVAAAPSAEEPPAAAPPAEVPLVVVPEAAQSTPEARLPIFESVESDWFHARRQPPLPVTPPAVTPRRTALARKPPSDDGWRAAETILTPAIGGVTAAGLPRRIPRANPVPGSAGNQEDRSARPADPAEVVSSRLAGFQRGSRRARTAAPGARPPDK
jgi:hypothetical protein